MKAEKRRQGRRIRKERRQLAEMVHAFEALAEAAQRAGLVVAALIAAWTDALNARAIEEAP